MKAIAINRLVWDKAFKSFNVYEEIPLSRAQRITSTVDMVVNNFLVLVGRFRRRTNFRENGKIK